MKGLFIVKKDQLAILELPDPIPGPYEALVQVEACAICNSTDWKLIEGEFVSGTYPVLLGHESVGQVIQTGSKVSSFKVGDRVLRSTLQDTHIPYPGGRSCWGGFVEKALVTDVWAKKSMAYNAYPHPQQIIPTNITPTQATALITLKETLSCLENTNIRPGHSLAIIGTGPVAQALTLFAKLTEVSPIVVFGRQPMWTERFFTLGADDYVAGENISPNVQSIIANGGFDRVIEAVGAQEALSRSLVIVDPNGRVNLYGIPPQSAPYLAEEEKDPRVFRSKVDEAEVHAKILRWVTEGKINLADWLSHILPWTDYQTGFDLVRTRMANKVVLTF